MKEGTHFDGGRFVNATGPAGQALSAVRQMLLEAGILQPAEVTRELRANLGVQASRNGRVPAHLAVGDKR